MRPNNDARVDLKRRMIVLTGTRCTYFELKTTHKAFCMVIFAAIHNIIKKEKCLLFKHEKNNQTLSND
jgi:2-keto-3-deoxy-galactonokinase